VEYATTAVLQIIALS